METKMELTSTWDREDLADVVADDADLAERVAEYIDLDDPARRTAQVVVSYPRHCELSWRQNRVTDECSFAWAD